MTERLYYSDSYRREFQAQVIDRAGGGRTLYLDRTAFYPTSGGQPHDTGSIGGVPVLDVIDEGERIAHLMDGAVAADDARCLIDWPRRFDHMQQHSGQHLLSAVFIEQYGIETVSFHLGQDVSTIDLEAKSVEAEKIAGAERRANEIVNENRPIAVTYESAEAAGDLRKPSERSGTLRIVSIEGLDRIACGGTHVRLTGEIGPILIRRQEKIRDTVRLQFLCGSRAVARARADYDALSRVAQAFSAAPDETPGLVAAQLESARETAKTRRKLEADLARYQGRELWQAAAPDASGVRRVFRSEPKGSMEELRALAQSVTSQPQAVFVGSIAQPPSVLFAVSADAGIDAGKTLQPLLKEAGGNGGGSPRMAQGGLTSREALDQVLRALGAAG